MKRYKNIFIIALLLSPSVAFAALTGVKDLITAFGGLINPLIAITVALALLGFFWGLVKFIFHLGGDENAVKEGKRVMLWGIIALFVMISIWGIINFMQEAAFPDSSFSNTSIFP